MNKEEMKRRTEAFALGVIALSRTLPRSVEAGVIARQMIRSGTSVGANYRAACLAKSTADFISKMQIVLEEVDESRYWMELLVEGAMCSSDAINQLMREAAELTSVAAASVITARQRQKARVVANRS